MIKNYIAGNCKICNRKHSSLLHFESKKDKESKDKPLSSYPNSDLSLHNEKPESAICHHTSLEGSLVSKLVLLSTVIVKVKDKNEI